MQNPKEIVSWITENNYSKSKEFIYFFLSLGIPTALSFCLGRYLSKFHSKQAIIEVEKPSKFSWLLYVITPLILYFLILNLDINGQIDLYHEGERLQLNGLPYKDLYIQHGLILNYLLPKLSSIIFSNSVEGVRRMFSIIEPVAYIILYFVGLSFFRGRIILAILPPIFCSGIAYWVGFREGLCIAVLLSLLNQRIFLAGLLSGLAFWFSVDYGLYSIAATLSYLALSFIFEKRDFTTLIKYLSGLALMTIPALAIFFVLGILNDFLINLYIQTNYQSIIWGKPFIEFDLDIWSESFRIYASILILIISLSFLAYKLGKNELFNCKYNRKLLLITLFATFFFRTALGRSDYGHWIDGSSLIILLLFAPFDSFIFSGHKRLIKALASCSFILLLAYLNVIHQPLQRIRISGFLIRERYNRLKNYFPEKSGLASQERIGNIKIPEDQLKTIIEVKNYIEENTNKADFIYDFANQGAYYFLLDRPSPTKYFNVVYSSTVEMQNEVIDELEKKKPKVVIFSTGTIYDGIDGIPSSKRHKIVYNYIIKNYSFAKLINGTSLYLLKTN